MKTKIKTNQKIFDSRYNDVYIITEISPATDLQKEMAIMQYERGALRTDSVDSILYYMQAGQHSIINY
jgi:hypothetical protein